MAVAPRASCASKHARARSNYNFDTIEGVVSRISSNWKSSPPGSRCASASIAAVSLTNPVQPLARTTAGLPRIFLQIFAVTRGAITRGEAHHLSTDQQLSMVSVTRPSESTHLLLVLDISIPISAMKPSPKRVPQHQNLERYRETCSEVLRLLIAADGIAATIWQVIATLKARLGLDAVGIRLQDGEDWA